MQIYAGTTNPTLAKKIATKLNTKLADVELSTFPNGETRVWIKESHIPKQAIVVQSFAPNPNHAIIEYALIVDALRRSGATDITAVIPWLGYCIQDKIFRKGEPLSAKVVADLVQATNPSRVITFDLHNESIQGFFNSQITHLSATPLYLKHFTKTPPADIIIAPDVGALKETTNTAHALGLPIAIINKKRDYSTGQVKIVGVDGQIKGKKALITDDFVSTGGTLIQTAKYLKEKGVTHITVAVTHHLFIKGAHQKLLQSPIDDLYVTDTIQKPPKLKLSSKSTQTHIISIADTIAQELQK